MSDPSTPDDELTPAERALATHMELLRASPPSPAPGLVAHIVHAARWQRALRRPLNALAEVTAAVVDAVRLLFSGGSRP